MDLHPSMVHVGAQGLNGKAPLSSDSQIRFGQAPLSGFPVTAVWSERLRIRVKGRVCPFSLATRILSSSGTSAFSQVSHGDLRLVILSSLRSFGSEAAMAELDGSHDRASGQVNSADDGAMTASL